MRVACDMWCINYAFFFLSQREDSLSKLRTVFPSTKSDKSLRREVPVFCATGQKPHMVS